MSWRMRSLKDAATLLASDAELQLDHLRKLGMPEGIDEIALEFDDIAVAVDDMLKGWELNKNQYKLIKELDALLARMSGAVNARLWTVEGLTSASPWKEVRRAAKKCLQLLGTPG